MHLADPPHEHDEWDFLHAVAMRLLQLTMEADIDGVIVAGERERSDGRVADRNGRAIARDTPLGALTLRLPKLRQGSRFPGFLEPRRTSEKALVAVMREAWIGGVSILRVEELEQAMAPSSLSKSVVSKLRKGEARRQSCQGKARKPQRRASANAPPAERHGPASGSTPPTCGSGNVGALRAMMA